MTDRAQKLRRLVMQLPTSAYVREIWLEILGELINEKINKLPVAVKYHTVYVRYNERGDVIQKLQIIGELAGKYIGINPDSGTVWSGWDTPMPMSEVERRLNAEDWEPKYQTNYS